MATWLFQLIGVPLSLIALVNIVVTLEFSRPPLSVTRIAKAGSLVVAQTLLIVSCFSAAQLSPMVFGVPAYARTTSEIMAQTTWLGPWVPASYVTVGVVLALVIGANLACANDIEIAWSCLQLVFMIATILSAILGLICALVWQEDAILSRAIFAVGVGLAVSIVWTRFALLSFFAPRFADEHEDEIVGDALTTRAFRREACPRR